MNPFTLVSIDNKVSAGNNLIGAVNDFKYNGSSFNFGSLNSSEVSSIEHYNGNLTVITRNSVYKFKKVIDDK